MAKVDKAVEEAAATKLKISENHIRELLQDNVDSGLQLVFDKYGSVTMSFGVKAESINIQDQSDEQVLRTAGRVMQPPKNKG